MKSVILSFLIAAIYYLPVFSQNEVVFTEHSIDEDFKGISTICVKDLDNDGLKDLVCGSETTSATSLSIGLWWMKNNGDNTWSKYEIDANFNNVMSIELVDINKDGNIDILASAWSSHQIAYWLNDGSAIPNWTKVVVKSSFSNAHDAHAFDINKDSLIDIVGLSAYLGKVVVWYQQSDGSFLEQVIDNTFTGARALAIADYNNDGNIDVSAVSATKKQLVVYSSNSENPIVWTKDTISTNLDGAHEVINFDADNDGDIDLLTSSYNSNKIDVWLNNGENQTVWTNQFIGNHVGVNRALPFDYDNDGNIDIVATGKYPTSKLSVWKNLGGNPIEYEETIINDQLSAFWALAIDDFDNDGDLDFVAGASVSAKINWYENTDLNVINQIKKNSFNVNVYPNPNNGVFDLKIESSIDQNITVKVVNSLGQLVYNNSFKSNNNIVSSKIDIKNCTQGIYNVIIATNKGISSKKVIIMP